MAQKMLSNFTPPGSSESYKFRAGALFYGITSNSTTAMTVSIPGVTEYYTGLTLILTMGAQAASGCTLNVNSLGAKPMKYGASASGTYFTSGATYLFVYDGTNFTAIHSYNSNTTYSSMSASEGATGTATTLRTLTAANLKSIINAHAPTKTGSGASGTWGINISGNSAYINSQGRRAVTHIDGELCNTIDNIPNPGLTIYEYYSTTAPGPTSYGNILAVRGHTPGGTQLALPWSSSNTLSPMIRSHSDWTGNQHAWGPWKKIWIEGDAVTGAVWNDYAEYRESDCEEFGYVLTENGDDTLSKTTERLQHFAGVSSDTWGFSQGETERARTPIAVAGRVLVYPYQDRDNYKPGDCVCAAPGGTVDIMTREEIRDYPDRIVGTVSCVPTYDVWGGGELADRKSVQVDGRIWIKVR